MIGDIIFSVVALVLFVYFFLFKLIRKNDTTYFLIIGLQAIGITINFIRIIFKMQNYLFINIIVYLLSIIIPTIVIILEVKGLDFVELVYVSVAKMMLVLKKDKRAKDIIVKLLNKNDTSYKAHLILAQIYEKSGGIRRAIDEYVRCIDLNKNDYQSYFRISKLLNEQKKPEQSIEMLKRLLSKRPEFYEARELLGDILADQKMYKEAIDNYSYILRKDEENWKIYYNLGIVYAMINDFKNSKDCFEKATEINGDLYKAYYKLGQIALLYRDIEIAEVYFAKSLYEEYEGRASYELAKIYILKNDRTKASIFINKAIEMDPKYYKIVKEEPMFIVIKNSINKPKDDAKEYLDKRTQKEIEIENYLSETYILTKEIENKDK